MVTITGEFIVIDNVKCGWSIQEGEEDRIYFAATDQDMGKTFLVGMPVNKFDQFCQLGKQTILKKSIEVAGADEMPKGPKSA